MVAKGSINLQRLKVVQWYHFDTAGLESGTNGSGGPQDIYCHSGMVLCQRAVRVKCGR